MSKIRSQESSLFNQEKYMKQLQDELTKLESERSKYKIELKQKRKEIEYAMNEFSKHEEQRAKLLTENIKMSSKVEGLEKLTDYYFQVINNFYENNFYEY